MLRQMAGGGPVRVGGSTLGPYEALGRLAFYAQQFGYMYTDVGMTQRKLLIGIVPDPSPQAQARAAENRARYPDAVDGGALPPLDPDAVALFKARIHFDLNNRESEKMKIGLSVFFAGLLGIVLAAKAGPGAGAGVWAALMALMLVGIFRTRHTSARHAALLEAAGFTPVTEPMGRRRYLPPTGQTGQTGQTG
jgi:hypothetical protein